MTCSRYSQFIDTDGIWCEQRTKPTSDQARPALFLDRDGVIVEEVHYLHKPEDCRLIAGAANVIASANNAGWWTIIVTNQAGIARGYYDWSDFDAVQNRMIEDLAANGAKIDAVYACPHHHDGQGQFRHPNHPARKPNPGMLIRAARVLPIDLSASCIIGDRASDIGAGRSAGLGFGLHVTTGHGAREGERAQAMALASDDFRVFGIASIKDAQTTISQFPDL